MSGSDLARAKAEAAIRRQRMIASAQALQARLKPAAIADTAMESAKRKGEELAEEAVEAVKRRPVAASAAVAGAAAMLGFGIFTRIRKNSDNGDAS